MPSGMGEMVRKAMVGNIQKSGAHEIHRAEEVGTFSGVFGGGDAGVALHEGPFAANFGVVNDEPAEEEPPRVGPGDGTEKRVPAGVDGRRAGVFDEGSELAGGVDDERNDENHRYGEHDELERIGHQHGPESAGERDDDDAGNHRDRGPEDGQIAGEIVPEKPEGGVLDSDGQSDERADDEGQCVDRAAESEGLEDALQPGVELDDGVAVAKLKVFGGRGDAEFPPAPGEGPADEDGGEAVAEADRDGDETEPVGDAAPDDEGPGGEHRHEARQPRDPPGGLAASGEQVGGIFHLSANEEANADDAGCVDEEDEVVGELHGGREFRLSDWGRSSGRRRARRGSVRSGGRG